VDVVPENFRCTGSTANIRLPISAEFVSFNKRYNNKNINKIDRLPITALVMKAVFSESPNTPKVMLKTV